MSITAENYRINELMRFRILVGGICASLCISTFYGFNLLSNYMVLKYGFTANDLTTITTTGIVVGFVTFPGGMLLDYAGPMWVLMIATFMNTLGALLFGLSFNDIIKGNVVKFAVFCAIMNFGCAAFDTGSLMAIMGSFPVTKGSCVAIMKTFAGLGASIFSVIILSFFNDKYAAYMYFMAGVVVVAGSIATFFIRFPPYHLVDWEKKHLDEETKIRRCLTEKAYFTQYPPMRRFYLGYGVVICLVIYLTTQSLCTAYVSTVTHDARIGITVGAIVLTFCLLLVAAPFPFLGGMSQPYSTRWPDVAHHAAGSAQPDEYMDAEEQRVLKPTEGELKQDAQALDNLYVEEPTFDDEGAGKKDTAGAATVEQGLEIMEDDTVLRDENDMDPQYQGTFWHNLLTPELWCCWWNTLATWGCGVVISFNSAQIYRALAEDNYEQKTNVLYSAIIGIGAALGRMSMGIFETRIVLMPSSRRPVLSCVYPVASATTVVGLIFLVALPLRSKAILVGFFFDAFGNGFSWACTALMMRTLYAKDIGKHYNFMFVGVFIAVIALNRFAYGEQYTREAKKQRAQAEANGEPGIYPRCSGKMCIRNALIILICVNSTAIVASTFLHIRFRRFVMKHRREREAARAARNEEPTSELIEASS